MIEALLLLVLGPQAPAEDAPDPPEWSVLRLDAEEGRAVLEDVDGDGDADLVVAGADGLSLRRMDAAGRYREGADAPLRWPSDQVAWTVADLDGAGGSELVLFVDNGKVVRHPVGEGGFGEAETVLEARGDLPRGVFAMDFCRDVDGDGTLEVVLPATDHYAIHRRAPEGWLPPIEIAMSPEVETDLARPGRLGERLGQEVRIPWFVLEDVDGDGRPDLRAETEEHVYFHIADPELSPRPTWVLDVGALEDELPRTRGVDLDDLLSEAARQVSWRLVDMDPGRPRDLLIQVGSKFRLYHGGARTGPAGKPDQLLKSSGNVLFYFLRDVDGDGRVDLQLLRGEGLSLGRIVRWLVLPGSLDFQLYTYAGVEGRFATSPTRRNTITLRIPRLLPLLERLEEREEREKEEEEPVAGLFALDADGLCDDLVDCRDGEILVYRGGAVPQDARALAEVEESGELTAIVEHFLLDDLDRRGDGATRSLDFEELEAWDLASGKALREASLALEPASVLPLAVGVVPTSLHVRDLNGDGRGDLIVIGREPEGGRCVQLLVR